MTEILSLILLSLSLVLSLFVPGHKKHNYCRITGTVQCRVAFFFSRERRAFRASWVPWVWRFHEIKSSVYGVLRGVRLTRLYLTHQLITLNLILHRWYAVVIEKQGPGQCGVTPLLYHARRINDYCMVIRYFIGKGILLLRCITFLKRISGRRKHSVFSLDLLIELNNNNFQSYCL